MFVSLPTPLPEASLIRSHRSQPPEEVQLALAILAEAGLSFLGLGTPAPYASWGRMLQASQPYLATAPHLALWPGLAIALTVLGFNLIGGGSDRR